MLRSKHKEEDVFIIKKAEQSEIADVLYIHSCVDQLKFYMYYLRKKMGDNLSVPFFISFEELLSNMIFFVTETESQDPFNCEGIPNQRR